METTESKSPHLSFIEVIGPNSGVFGTTRAKAFWVLEGCLYIVDDRGPIVVFAPGQWFSVKPSYEK